MIGEIKAVSVTEFWNLDLREVNLIIEGHEKAIEQSDIRMRRGWLYLYRSAGVKEAKESQLWPMLIDQKRIEEIKRRNIAEFDKIKEFAQMTDGRNN